MLPLDPRGDAPAGSPQRAAPLDVVGPLLRLLVGTARPARRMLGRHPAPPTPTAVRRDRPPIQPCVGLRADDHAHDPALQHALQCAHAAERHGAADALIAAALLHDIGHALDPDRARSGIDDLHEMRALPLLAQAFGPSVTEPVRLHVQAKRYLVSADLTYLAHLPDGALQSLAHQGGPMTGEECRLFERLPYAEQAVALRRWDDEAHVPGAITPPLDHYRPLLEALSRQPVPDPAVRRATRFGT